MGTVMLQRKPPAVLMQRSTAIASNPRENLAMPGGLFNHSKKTMAATASEAIEESTGHSKSFTTKKADRAAAQKARFSKFKK